MRKVIKKFLDVDLESLYTSFESKSDNISEGELLELDMQLRFANFDALNEEEEFLKKLGQLKDKAMDKLFGAKKGADAGKKTSKGQSAKLQKTSGETNFDSQRMTTLQSNKLPLILAGIGGALGALGWIAQTEWFKGLITKTIHHPAEFAEKTFTETIEKNIKVDPRGWSYTIQNNGFQDITGKSLNFNQPVENLKDAFEFYGGGDQSKGIEAMSNFLGKDVRADSVADITSQLADPSNKTIGDIFNKLEGTWGDKFLMNQDGGAKSFIAKQVFTYTKNVLVRAGFTTTTTSIVGGKLVAIAPILTGIGIALVSAGAVVKLLREKGQRQSRAKTLNDLLQSLVPIRVGKGERGEVSIKGETGEVLSKGELGLSGDIKVPTEKTIYPLMIKNLTQLKGLLESAEGVKLEGEGGEKKKLTPGREYIYTNKKGDKKRVKVISTTHDMSIGGDKRWLTKDDEKVEPLKGDNVSVIFKDKKGEFSSSSPEMAVDAERLVPVGESITISKFSDFMIEEKTFGTSRNVEVKKGEDYLMQAVTNIRKSIKNLKDEGDKGIGITSEFISEILDKKMESETKQPVKDLYREVYEYMFGNKSKTLSDLGPLYKESVQTISNKAKRQVVAEKIARFAKRATQFEGEGFYGGLGEFGEDMKDWNTSFGGIMAYFKSTSEAKESRVVRFGEI